MPTRKQGIARDRRGLPLAHARAPIARRLHPQAQPCGEAGGRPGVLEKARSSNSVAAAWMYFCFQEIRMDSTVQFVQGQNEPFVPCGYLVALRHRRERTCVELVRWLRWYDRNPRRFGRLIAIRL